MLPGSSLILTRIAPVRNYIGKFFRETPLLTYMLWCRSLCPQEGGTFYSHRQKKGLTNPPLLGIITLSFADLAHLVERHLAKVEVASSSLVIRSNKESKAFCLAFFVLQYCETRTGQSARIATVRGTVAVPACVPVRAEAHRASLVIRSNKESKAFCLAFFVLQLLRDSNRAIRQDSNSPGDCCDAHVRAGARSDRGDGHRLGAVSAAD